MVIGMREQNLSPKVRALYEAVRQLMEEDSSLKDIKVSDITSRAGIGKGTAYDYFKNKEEIISSALFYHMNLICCQVKEKFDRMDSFGDMIKYALACMDQEIRQRDCFIKFIHILSDNGLISRLLQEKISSRDADSCMPEDLLKYMIDKGIDNGDIKEKLPRAYMSMTIASKLMVYAMYITDEEPEKVCKRVQMHKLICDSLLKEFN